MNALICLIIGITVLFREIVLTRFFSVTVNYSYTAVAISVAILGLTIGSFYYSLNSQRLERLGSLRLLRLLFLLAAVACFVPLLPLLTFLDDLGFLSRLSSDKLRLILPLMSFPPFFVEGILLNRALSRQVDRVRRLYFYNLVGSGLGALLAIIGLTLLGAIGSLIFCAVILSVVGLIIALRDRQTIRWPLAMIAAVVICTALLRPSWQRAVFRIPPSDVIVQDHSEWIGWNTISRVMVSEPGRQDLFRGMALDDRIRKGPYKVASIDSISWGPIIKFDGRFDEVSFLRYEISSLAWSIRSKPTVFIIGPAGGRDVLMSLMLGSKDVYAAEINPIFNRDLMLGRYHDYSGRIYSRENVHITTDDGRSALRKMDTLFDIILFNSVETRSATERGSLNLSENSIFTLQAMQEYYDHLSEDGLLAFTLIGDQAGQRAVRFVNLAKTAFRTRGVDDFSKHLFVAEIRRTHHYLFKKTPFTPGQLRTLRRATRDKLVRLIWAPDGKHNDPAVTAAVRAVNDAELAKNFRFNITPPTDNRPYLFFFPLWQDFFLPGGAAMGKQTFGNVSYIALLTNLKVILLACSFAYILCSFAGQHRSVQGGFSLTSLSLAYLIITLGLLSRGYADWILQGLCSGWICLLLAFVLVWSLRQRSKSLARFTEESKLKSPWPLIIFTLVAGLVLNALAYIYLAFFQPTELLLRAVLIVTGAYLVVHFVLANRSVLFGWTRSKAQHFGYMAMLGVGFLLVELAVLQKLNLLLARPVYSLTVGLGGFLVAAGLGSLLSGLFRWQSRGLRLALAALVLVLFGYVLALDRIIDLCLAWDYPAKITVSVLLIIPPALIMGIPFSTAMSLISRTKAQHTAWLYGISSVFSVLGAAAATVISLYAGFTVGLFCGAMCYLFALLLAPATAAHR